MNEEELRLRHEQSLKDYPKLKLDQDEFVVYAFLRLKICLGLIWGSVAAGLILACIVYLLIAGQPYLDEMGKNFLGLIFIVVSAVAIFAGIFASMLHFNNKLFVTNHRVMQYIMLSPFSTSYNVIDLSSIEDVSFRQETILQKLFHFGTLRLSTVGDETTYTLKNTFVTRDQINVITRMVSDDKDSNH